MQIYFELTLAIGCNLIYNSVIESINETQNEEKTMFGFTEMIDNYEERVVKNDKIGNVVIDTAAVTDSDQPYETGIKSPSYNDGR